MRKSRTWQASGLGFLLIFGFCGCSDNDAPSLTVEGDQRLKLLLLEPLPKKPVVAEEAEDPVELASVPDKEVVVNCAPGLQFDVTEIEAIAGQKLNIIFKNPDSMPHNIVFVQPGSETVVADAAMEMMQDGSGQEKGYVPEIKEVIVGSKLIPSGGSDQFSVRFDKPGSYPYICSFPGHSTLMKGVVKVAENVGSGAASAAPADKEVVVNCAPGLQFDVTEIEAIAGQKLNIVFKNPDSMPHNIVFVQPGSETVVANAAMAMMQDGSGQEKGYVPEIKEVIVGSKLIPSGGSDQFSVRFDKPGSYPYICSFPGHSTLMKGVVKVAENEGSVAASAAPEDKEVAVNCAPGLKFDVTEIRAQSGQKLNIIFKNPDSMPHNIVFVQPGSETVVANAAMAMMQDGSGQEKGYVPEIEEVIVGSKLIPSGGSDQFSVCFDKPGTYPYICTFPGHSTLMKGVVVVEK